MDWEYIRRGREILLCRLTQIFLYIALDSCYRISTSSEDFFSLDISKPEGSHLGFQISKHNPI